MTTNDSFLDAVIESVSSSHINQYDPSLYESPLPKGKYAFATLMSFAREALSEGCINAQRFSHWEDCIKVFASTL